MATQSSNAVAITGGSVTGLPTPSLPSDAATKSYTDALAIGLNILPQSALATAAALPNSPTYSNGTAGVGATLTAGANSTLTVDGTVAPLNTVVLVKNQASAFQNGPYTVTNAGSGSAAWVLTRVTYFDQAAEMKGGSYTFVTSGSTNLNASFALQTGVTTVGTDPLTFNLFSLQGVANIGGTAGIVTLAPELGISSNILGLAVPPRSASVNLNNVNQSWIPPSPNNYHLFIAQAVLFNQGNLFASRSGSINAAFIPPSGTHLIHLVAQTWVISGVANAGSVTAKWIKNATVDGSFNEVTGQQVCAGIGALSDFGPNTAVMRADCYDVPSPGDYYNLFMFVDSTSLGSTTVTVDGNPPHTYAQATVVY